MCSRSLVSIIALYFYFFKWSLRATRQALDPEKGSCVMCVCVCVCVCVQGQAGHLVTGL